MMTCYSSNLFRSPKLTINDITQDFPDNIQDFVSQMVDKMIKGYFLIEHPSNDEIAASEEEKRYVINPNKKDDIKKLLFK